MKRIFIFVLVLAVLCVSPLYSTASNVVSTENNFNEIFIERINFDDGSYIITTLVVENDVSDNANSTRSDSESYIKRAQRYAKGYDSNDELDWIVTLTGEFLVCPTCPMSGQCQSSKLTAVYYDTSWGMYDVDERCMSNNAYGACSMKDKFLGITTKIVDLEMVLTCDRYGNITILGQPTS